MTRRIEISPGFYLVSTGGTSLSQARAAAIDATVEAIARRAREHVRQEYPELYEDHTEVSTRVELLFRNKPTTDD